MMTQIFQELTFTNHNNSPGRLDTRRHNQRTAVLNMLTATRFLARGLPTLAAAAPTSHGFGHTGALRHAGGGPDRSNEDRATERERDSSGLTPGAYGGATAGSDAAPGSGPRKDLGQVEGRTSGGIAGAWRGMTSSFSVGADDMAGDSAAGTVEEDIAMKVNPDDGLPPGPSESTGPAAEARAGGFGQQRDPQAPLDKEAPADLAQKARDANTGTGSQPSSEGAVASGDKPWGS